MYVTIFLTDWGQKPSLTKLVLKRSVLKQSLQNIQHKLLMAGWYEGYIEILQNFIMYVTIFVTDWRQKTSLSKLVLTCFAHWLCHLSRPVAAIKIHAD
jgi:hypothetical protein